MVMEECGGYIIARCCSTCASLVAKCLSRRNVLEPFRNSSRSVSQPVTETGIETGSGTGPDSILAREEYYLSIYLSIYIEGGWGSARRRPERLQLAHSP